MQKIFAYLFKIIYNYNDKQMVHSHSVRNITLIGSDFYSPVEIIKEE